jgi:hypothetical protein
VPSSAEESQFLWLPIVTQVIGGGRKLRRRFVQMIADRAHDKIPFWETGGGESCFFLMEFRYLHDDDFCALMRC